VTILSSSLLTDAKVRLDRHGTKEVMQRPFFDGTLWETLHFGMDVISYVVAVPHTDTEQRYPPELRLPQTFRRHASHSRPKTRTKYNGTHTVRFFRSLLSGRMGFGPSFLAAWASCPSWPRGLFAFLHGMPFTNIQLDDFSTTLPAFLSVSG
jgi:hypothetical protein